MDEVLSVGPDHAVAIHKHVVIGMWRRQPRVGSVQAAYDGGKLLRERSPGGMAYLIIAERPSTPPDADARAVFLRMMKEFNGFTRCSAVVAEGGSLSVSLVRGVMTGLLILARHDTPTRMFATVGEAAAWLRSTLLAAKAEPVEPDALVRAVDALRARMDAAEKQDAPA